MCGGCSSGPMTACHSGASTAFTNSHTPFPLCCPDRGSWWLLIWYFWCQANSTHTTVVVSTRNRNITVFVHTNLQTHCGIVQETLIVAFRVKAREHTTKVLTHFCFKRAMWLLCVCTKQQLSISEHCYIQVHKKLKGLRTQDSVELISQSWSRSIQHHAEHLCTCVYPRPAFF